MTHQITEIDYPQYLAAMPLIEALCAYSNAETLQTFDQSFPVDASGKPQSAQVLMALGETLSEVDKLNQQQRALLATMKAQVTEHIILGNLLAAGFLLPRQSTDKPVALSADFFISGEVNWDKSEIVTDGREYHAVRLLVMQPKNVKTNKFQRRGGVVAGKKRINHIDFDRIPASKQLNEKEAAAYLNMSSRMLQNLRVKGTGPEFSKQGQAIRYTKHHLSSWLAAQNS